MELGEGGEGGRDLVKEGRGEASKLHNVTVFGFWIKTLLCKIKPDSSTNIVTIFIMYRSEVRGPNWNQFGSRAPAGV